MDNLNTYSTNILNKHPTIKSISGGVEGEREVVDILAVEGGEHTAGGGPGQRWASGKGRLQKPPN